MNNINIVKHNGMKELLQDKRLTGIAKTVSEHDYFITVVNSKQGGVTIVDYEMPMTYDMKQFVDHSRDLYNEHKYTSGHEGNC